MVADLTLTPGRNPFEIVLVVAGLFAGAAGLFLPGGGSRIIHAVLPGYETVWNVCLIIGAGTSAVALMLPQPWTILIERVGMIWLAALFLPYGAAVLLLGGSPTGTGGVTITAYGLACAVRAGQISYHRRVLRRQAAAAEAAETPP